MPFLGVHLTRMIDGTVTVGPNAVLALKREGYKKTDFSLADMFEMFTSLGVLKVLKANLKPGLIEMRNSLFKGGYLQQVQKYCPSINKDDLTPYPPVFALRRFRTAVSLLTTSCSLIPTEA
jgi:L-2-hydroxyglutarate oxidase